MTARGIGPDEVDRFFGPALDSLHDPARLPDADRAVERIARARDAAEGVLVVGDFDADGLTGLAIMVRALRTLGIDAAPHVPTRLDDGHGLSLRAVELARAAGRRLVITVDTGSSSGSEIAAAGIAGIDVIVTDHHRVPPELPQAVAVVNPHRADASYPDRRLAGSGVALKIVALLLERLGGIPAELTTSDLADLATIGTVADVAPVLGENRAIARLGLERIRRDPRPGNRRAPCRGRRRGRGGDTGNGRVRARAAPQRSRPRRGRGRSGRPPAHRRSGGRRRPGGRARRGEPRSAGRVARCTRGGPGPRGRRGWTERRGRSRPRPVAGRDHRPCGRTAG